MIVNFHSHWYPERFLERVVALGRTDIEARGQSPDLSDRVAEMERVGVDKAVLSFVGLNAELPDAAGLLETSRLLNDLYRDARDRHPGRFEQFAKVPLPFVDKAVGEAVRCFDELDAVGIALPCSYTGHILDDPAFDPLWAEIDRRGAIAFIHPAGSDSEVHWGLDTLGMNAMYGSPMQIALAATRIVFTGIPRRFPRIKFLFAQGGGNLPSRWHALNRILGLRKAPKVPPFLQWVKDLDLDESDPLADFRRFYYDTSMQETPATMAMCREGFGVDRLVLGSDTAFGSLTGVVDFIRTTDSLDANEKKTILETNSDALLARPA